VKMFIRLAVLAAAACLALTACGGGGSTPAASGSGGAAPSPTASASSSASAALSAFDTCLKAHGVKTTFKPRAFPSGGVRPTSRPTAFPTAHRSPGAGFGGFATNSADAAAFKACQKYAPTGFGRGFGGFGGGNVTASAIAAFKTCMTQNGVTVTGSTVQAIFSQLRTATGKTATAFKACRVLIQSSATPSPSPSA
jgi:hypothetical protein